MLTGSGLEGLFGAGVWVGAGGRWVGGVDWAWTTPDPRNAARRHEGMMAGDWRG